MRVRRAAVAGGAAEDVEGAGDVGLGADDRPHEGRLSAARGAEQAGDLAARDGEVEVAQDGAGASDDGETFGLDGPSGRGVAVIHHVMNNALGPAGRQAGWGRGGGGLGAQARGEVIGGGRSASSDSGGFL